MGTSFTPPSQPSDAARRQPGPEPATSLPTAPLPADPALEAALVGLVADGTLSEAQARAVRAARAGAEEAAPVGAATVPRPSEPSEPSEPVEGAEGVAAEPTRHNPLPEILGFVGAALIGSAVLNLVGQSWDSWSDTVHLLVVGVATVAAYTGAVVLLALSGWRPGLAAAGAGRRSLVALLLAAGAGFAGITALVLQNPTEIAATGREVLVAGVLALVLACAGAWCVRNVLSTLAVAAGTLWVGIGLMATFLPHGPTWYVPMLVTLAGLAWLVAAPRLLAVPALSEALGWAFLVSMLLPPAMAGGEFSDPADPYLADMQLQAWVSRGLLAGLAVLGMVVFLRGGRWPWAAGGVASAVATTLAIGSEAFNWILAMLAAGVVLLLLGVLMIAVRRRRDRRGSSA